MLQGSNRFSLEYRKINTKVIAFTNDNRRRQSNEPIRTGAKRGKTCTSKLQLILVLVLPLIVRRSGGRYLFLANHKAVVMRNLNDPLHKSKLTYQGNLLECIYPGFEFNFDNNCLDIQSVLVLYPHFFLSFFYSSPFPRHQP